MNTNTITRIIALPLLSAGIFAAGLGLAGGAGATTTTTSTNGSHSMVSAPDTTAHNPTVNTWRNRHRNTVNQNWRH